MNQRDCSARPRPSGSRADRRSRPRRRPASKRPRIESGSSSAPRRWQQARARAAPTSTLSSSEYSKTPFPSPRDEPLDELVADELHEMLRAERVTPSHVSVDEQL